MIDFKYSEGATPIDLDEAEGLLLTHITTHGELNRWEQDNIVEALAWIDKTKPTNILNCLMNCSLRIFVGFVVCFEARA
jgi:hypothetical protein